MQQVKMAPPWRKHNERGGVYLIFKFLAILDGLLQEGDGLSVGQALEGGVRDLLQPLQRTLVHPLADELQVSPDGATIPTVIVSI